MIDDGHHLECLLNEFNAELKRSRAAGAAAGNACAIWKNLRPIVLKLINALNTIGLLFPKAKLAAKALDTLRGLLDTLCGTAVAAEKAANDPLLVRLDAALQTKGANAAPATSPCGNWANLRPIIIDAIADLRALAKVIPWLSKVADVLDELRQLVDSLCGSPPPPPGPGTGAAGAAADGLGPAGAAGSSILAWEDDPYLIAIGLGDPVAATPIVIPVPVNNQPLLKTQITTAEPPAQQYPLGTAQFRFWNAAAALARGINLWGPILPGGTQWSTAFQPMQVTLDEGVDFNAFYARDSGLNFFHGVVDKVSPPVTVYSGESPHVVTHELGHAILDAVKPELFDAMSAEVAAFHEAFGDMSSTLSALQLDSIRRYVLNETGGVLTANSRLSQLARQLGWAIRVEFGASLVDNDCLRNTANNFFYQDPTTLPPNAPASSLSSEPHSFSRVFSGAFLDVLAKMFTIGPITSTTDASAALEAVSLDAGILLIQGARLATVGPGFYGQVAAGMVQADQTLNGGHYGAALVSSFVKRGILEAASAVSLLRSLAAPAAAATYGITSGGPGENEVGFAGDNQGFKKTGPNTPELPLSPISTRFGVTLHVRLPAEPKRFDVMAAAAGGGPRRARSAETEAKAFIEDLIQLGRVKQDGAGAIPKQMFGPTRREFDARKTHEIVNEEGKLVLKRRHFDCNFGCHTGGGERSL